MKKQHMELPVQGRQKILAVCHCILNPAAKVVSFDGEEYLAEQALRKDAVQALLRAEAGMLQLPCPELTLYGACRWGHVRGQLDNVFFRAHCRGLLAPVVEQLLEYAAHPERFCLLGILGVDGSPSCGVNRTCAGEWGGELFAGQAQRALPPAREAEGPGVLIEELVRLLKERGLALPVFSLHTFPGEFLAHLQKQNKE